MKVLTHKPARSGWSEGQKGKKRVKSSFVTCVYALALLGNKDVPNIPVHHERGFFLVDAVEFSLKLYVL